MQSTCKDIKNIPNPVLFIKIIFLLALKILKTSIFCNIFCTFAECILISESDSALGKIYFELRISVFILKAKNIYP
jgi:hypothetical protein